MDSLLEAIIAGLIVVAVTALFTRTFQKKPKTTLSVSIPLGVLVFVLYYFIQEERASPSSEESTATLTPVATATPTLTPVTTDEPTPTVYLIPTATYVPPTVSTIAPAASCPTTAAEASALFGGGGPDWELLDSETWDFEASGPEAMHSLRLPEGMRATWTDQLGERRTSVGADTVGPTARATIKC